MAFLWVYGNHYLISASAYIYIYKLCATREKKKKKNHSVLDVEKSMAARYVAHRYEPTASKSSSYIVQKIIVIGNKMSKYELFRWQHFRGKEFIN